MRAINKFNEWRNNQRFQRLNETKNTTGITQVTAVDQSIMTNDYSMISDVFIDDNEKRRLIEIQREMKHQVSFKGNTKNHRLSLPIMNDKQPEKPQRRKNRKSQVHPSNTIDEIEEFEQNHCGQMDEDYPVSIKSPPSQFFRNNSDTFFENKNKSQDQPKEPTPRRQSLMGRNMLMRSKSAGKGKAPQPPIEESEASSNFYNGNFKHYDVNSASVYDEFIIASKAYKANLRSKQPEKINSVGESASSGSLSSDPDKNLKKMRRLSPPYQTVINKHGDEVEYALPYSERDSLPPLPNTPAPDAAKIPQSQFEQIINENFQFLNSNLEYFNAEESLINRQIVDAAFEPIETSFSDIRRRCAQVTDLDKSNDTGLVTPGQSGDNILKELDTLSKWTKNLHNIDKNVDINSPIADYQAIQHNIKIFNSHDIKYKSGILRNSFSTPLEFSTGYYRTTPVTLRSTLPNVYSINSFADVASKREFEILS